MLLAAVALLSTACGPDGEEFCGLPAAVPDTDEVSEGNFVADFTTPDGSEEAFSQRGSWGPGPSASIEAGVLSIIIARDESGVDVTDLIER